MSKKKVIVKWNKRQNDYLGYYPNRNGSALVRRFFNKMIPDGTEHLYKELKDAGFNPETLRFTVELLPEEPHNPE